MHYNANYRPFISWKAFAPYVNPVMINSAFWTHDLVVVEWGHV